MATAGLVLAAVTMLGNGVGRVALVAADLLVVDYQVLSSFWQRSAQRSRLNT